MNNIVYRFFSKFRLTAGVTKSIEDRMSIMYPGNREKIIKSTQFEIIRLLVCNSMILTGFIWFGKMDIYFLFMSAIVMVMVSKNLIYSKYNNMEIKLLKQFEKFLQDVRFNFRYDGMIDEALNDALLSADYEMQLQAVKIIDSLNKSEESNGKQYISDGKIVSEDYIEVAPNCFFLTFYAICQTVKEYGDKVEDGHSAFVTNLSFLKEDVNIEILKREKIEALFMGLLFVTIVPLFGIKPIIMWGIGNIPELENYYNGIIGKFTYVLLTIMTAFIFQIIMKLKYPLEYENQKSIWVEQLLAIPVINRLLLRIISLNYKKYYKMDLFLKSVVYKYNVKEFTVYKFVCGAVAAILSMILILKSGIASLGIFGILIGFFVFSLSVLIAYNYEMIMILFREKMLRLNREEEIIRYQSVIMILMNMDRITLEKILEWMEIFAVVFKNTLEKISDTIAYKGMEVFEDAKEKVEFLPFSRLMDSFTASDRIGIKSAFADVISDRAYYVEKHKQENEIIINNKAMIAKFMAFVPICAVICFVLIVPFVYVGMKQLQSFTMI